MNAKVCFFIFALWPCLAFGQGFAGLGQSTSDQFSVPVRDIPLVFPRDHGAHPDYRIEWWYLTATLEDENGASYGVQWTLFRSALAPETTRQWDSPQIWMGHAGLTTQTAHHSAEKFGRDGVGQAGVTVDPFEAWIDDWSMQSTALAPNDPLSRLEITAAARDWSYQLRLSADGPLVRHGERGYSVKSQTGQASYYYSQPFYTVEGSLKLPSGPVAVTGRAWLDREWSSQPLDENQTGWDWFSLHLDDGSKVMAFRLRSETGPDFTSGTWITPNGTAQPLPNGAIQMEPVRTAMVNGRDIPVDWALSLPSKQMAIQVRAIHDHSWMHTLFPYWEGPIAITGSHSGRGYLEMTGYTPKGM